MLSLILLLVMTPGPSPDRCQPDSDQASARLSLADGATSRRDFAAANTALDAALRELGSRYAGPETIDDTGMHLVVAGVQARKGKLKLAAELKRRVLLERLQLCRRPVGR